MKSYKQQRQEREELTDEQKEIYDYWSPYYPHERAMKEAKADPFPTIDTEEDWNPKYLKEFLNNNK